MLVVVSILAGCGDNGNRPVDAAIDAAPGAGAPACGPGPYVKYGGTIVDKKLDNTMPPLAGATLRIDECANGTETTPASGAFELEVTSGSPLTVEISKPGYITLISAQFTLASLNVLETVGLRASADWATASLMPGYDTTHGYMLVGVGTMSGTPPCNTPDGVTITLPGHAEATVHYLNTATPPIEDTGLTATSAAGVAYISGITPGTLAQSDIVFTKTGCTFALHGLTGNYKVAAGALTRLLTF